MKRRIKTAAAPEPSGPYSQAIVSNGLVFVAGQGPLDPATREVIGDDVVTQTRQVLRNLNAVLAAAGAGLADVVALRVFLADLADRPGVDDVIRESLPEPFPARTTIQTPLPRFLVEVDAIAEVKGRKSLPN